MQELNKIIQKMNIGEKMKVNYTLSEAILDKIPLKVQPPEPLTCIFCKKEIEQVGTFSFFDKCIWLWHPGSCHCSEAVREKERVKKEEEDKKKQEIMRARIKKCSIQSEIGERFKSRTFENFVQNKENEKIYKVALAYATHFEKNTEGRGLYIYGSVGTGKTHIAAAVANKLIEKSIPVIFLTSINLLSRIKETYNSNNELTEEKVINLLSTVNLLVIDDIGKEKPSMFTLEKFFEIINNRYERVKPIIFTSNFTSTELKIRYSNIDERSGMAISSRISEICSGAELTGEDWRER